MTYDPTTTRAVAVGLPARLRAEAPARVPGLVDMSHDLLGAARFIAENPHVAVIYGEELFGATVVGQAVFLLPGQRTGPQNPRVMLMIDIDPTKMDDLPWDDPRALVGQAGVMLNALSVIDTSNPSAWDSLNRHLDEVVDMPPAEGVSSS